MNRRALRWIDIDKIGQDLHREFPELLPDQVSATDLQAKITGLKHFNDSPYPPNAMYLDLIRDAWDDAINGVPADTTITTAKNGTDTTG